MSALRKRRRGFVEVNVVGSSVAREADAVLYTLAGPEIAVASTKAYSVQCALLWLISLRLSLIHGQITEEKAKEKCEQLLREVPAAVGGVLAREKEIAAFAPVYGDAEHLFFIGRGIDADLCTEASLKLKEISYVHSEAYAAGELKHGTISLIVGGVPVVALLTDPGLAEKTISGIREVLSRGARVLVFATEEIAGRFSLPGDRLFVLPPVPADMALFPAVCAMQLFAYFTAVARGCDVDKPRNLAKSVTVE